MIDCRAAEPPKPRDRVPRAFLLVIEERGGTEALVNVPGDDALEVHELLGVREPRITILVFRCDSSVAQRPEGAAASSC